MLIISEKPRILNDRVLPTLSLSLPLSLPPSLPPSNNAFTHLLLNACASEYSDAKTLEEKTQWKKRRCRVFVQ